MKKIGRISLHQLDRAELSKKEQDLLFGGGTPGLCRCGSCASKSGAGPTSLANQEANTSNGYTITGSNGPTCVCSIGSGSALAIVSTPSK